MNDLETPQTSFSLRRRLVWVAGAMTLAFLIVTLAVYTHGESRSANDLAAVLGGLDETDPGWRLEEIESARIRLKDNDNSAVLCCELAKLLGPNWPDLKVDDRLKDVPIGELLDEQQKVILEDEMARLTPIRDLARRMVALPRGRHKIDYKLNPFDTLQTDQQDVRKVANLFSYETRYRANKGDVSEAVRACRACVCAGRSLYDEPTMSGTLIRVAVVFMGTGGVERSLALGESNDGELKAMDALLAEEQGHNTLLVALRGERAMWYRVYSRAISGEIPPDVLEDIASGGEKSWLQRWFGNDRRTLRRHLPGMLEELTRAVEIARLPSHEQASAEAAQDAEVGDRGHPATLSLSIVRKCGEVCRRKTASVAAMRGLIAVERFRMKYKKWPAKLAEVVPEFIDRVPTDPFDGKPLKMAKTPDGVVVYSVGFNGVDDGGMLGRGLPRDSMLDIGYQLWDTAKRRRPASPPRPKPVEDEP
jgi:hypothetical protein